MQAGRDYTNIKYAAEVAGLCDVNKSCSSSTSTLRATQPPVANINPYGLGQPSLPSSLHRPHETGSMIKPPIPARLLSESKYPSKPGPIDMEPDFPSLQNYENLSLKDTRLLNCNNLPSHQAPPLPPRK